MAKTNPRISILSACILIALIGLLLFSTGASRLPLVAQSSQSESVAQQPKKTQEGNQEFGRNDKTKALQVDKVEVLPDGVKVSFRNVSTKTIDGIQLSINRGYLQIDFVGAEEEDYQRLLPGAVYEQFLSPRALSQPLDISVLAVTFDDRTFDGDPRLARQILDVPRGVNKQLKRIKRLLDAALSSTDADAIRVLDRLKSQLEGLPIDESTESSAIKRANTKQRQTY